MYIYTLYFCDSEVEQTIMNCQHTDSMKISAWPVNARPQKNKKTKQQQKQNKTTTTTTKQQQNNNNNNNNKTTNTLIRSHNCQQFDFGMECLFFHPFALWSVSMWPIIYLVP